MFYLLWLILNIGLVILFLFICFKGARYIREKIGLGAAIIFVFGLLSFINKPGVDHKPKAEWTRDQSSGLNIIDNQASHFEEILIEQNMMFRTYLRIGFNFDKQTGEAIPVSAHTRLDGTFGWTEWVTQNISISKTGKNFYSYHVNADIKNKLLGMTVIFFYKNYEGVLKTR